MERKVDDRTILDTFTESFCKVMEKHAKCIVCLGFVSIAHGRPRGTEDIDMIIEKLSKSQFILLHEELVKAGFICMQPPNPESIYDDYLIQGESVRYVKKSDGFFPPEMEIKFAKDKLDEEQLERRQKFPLTGLDIYFSPIEDNIAFKEELLKTDKDLEDARHLRIIYEEKVDESKINYIKGKIRKMRLDIWGIKHMRSKLKGGQNMSKKIQINGNLRLSPF